ncbi:unnamed protein product, partial [Ectocarpus sp. 8 AP-2014]
RQEGQEETGGEEEEEEEEDGGAAAAPRVGGSVDVRTHRLRDLPRQRLPLPGRARGPQQRPSAGVPAPVGLAPAGPARSRAPAVPAAQTPLAAPQGRTGQGRGGR